MSIYAYFEETAFDGLCYIRKKKSKFIQIFWIAIFLIGLGAAGKAVVTAVMTFMSNPTATEVTIMTKTSVVLPRIFICTSNRFNGTKIQTLNISDDLVAVLNHDFFPFSMSFVPPMTPETDIQELLKRTKSEYTQSSRRVLILQIMVNSLMRCTAVVKM